MPAGIAVSDDYSSELVKAVADLQDSSMKAVLAKSIGAHSGTHGDRSGRPVRHLVRSGGLPCCAWTLVARGSLAVRARLEGPSGSGRLGVLAAGGFEVELFGEGGEEAGLPFGLAGEG